MVPGLPCSFTDCVLPKGARGSLRCVGYPEWGRQRERKAGCILFQTQEHICTIKVQTSTLFSGELWDRMAFSSTSSVEKNSVASLLKLLRCNNNNLPPYRQSWFNTGLLGASKSTHFLEKVPRLSKGRHSCRADSSSVDGVDTAFFSHAQALTPVFLRTMTRWNL